MNRDRATPVLIRRAVEMREGAGAVVRRLMPVPDWPHYDPFVLWDHFRIGPGSGFPEHPHRGFEAVTYLFTGAMRHEDDLGNRSTVHAGGAQRFTAGRGIVHSEMPGGGEETRGIQLWINLPRRLKSVEPGYQQVDAADIPVDRIEGGQVAVIAGPASPLRLHTPVRYLDVRLEPGAVYRWVPPQGFRGFVYLAAGAAVVGGQCLEEGEAGFCDAAGEILIEAREPARLMICFGSPHGEPIRQHGPYVD